MIAKLQELLAQDQAKNNAIPQKNNLFTPFYLNAA
jgi:hypothetical protein